MEQNKEMLSLTGPVTRVCFFSCSQCLLMLPLSLCFSGNLLGYSPSHNREWLAPLWCNRWCDYWSLFIALPVDESSILLHTTTLHKFYFLFAWQPFVWAHSRELVQDWLTVAPLNRQSVQETLGIFSLPNFISLIVHFSLFPHFLSDLLISLGSGSFSSFGWMTSPVQWTQPGLPPLPHKHTLVTRQHTTKALCYKIAFRINWNDLLLSVCLELFGKSWSFGRKYVFTLFDSYIETAVDLRDCLKRSKKPAVCTQ